MRIKSKFVDYYDHVAHIYGGGDPKCVYVRMPFEGGKSNSVFGGLSYHVKSTNRDAFNGRFDLRWNQYVDGINKHLSYKILVIAGKAYLLAAKSDIYFAKEPYRLYTPENFPDTFIGNQSKFIFYGMRPQPTNYIGNDNPIYTEISKVVGVPVFMIERIFYDKDGYDIIIDRNIPILRDYGIPSLVSAEQMYQDLSYFVGNKIHDSPDLIVHDNMSDKEKILQHGFDVKQSFRHRM